MNIETAIPPARPRRTTKPPRHARARLMLPKRHSRRKVIADRQALLLSFEQIESEAEKLLNAIIDHMDVCACALADLRPVAIVLQAELPIGIFNDLCAFAAIREDDEPDGEDRGVEDERAACRCGPGDEEDAEESDPGGGNIEDVPHDEETDLGTEDFPFGDRDETDLAPVYGLDQDGQSYSPITGKPLWFSLKDAGDQSCPSASPRIPVSRLFTPQPKEGGQ